MNKKIILYSTILLWIALAAIMIVSKQKTLATGRVVLLETAPVDPRDFLRGDYVILKYKIDSLDLKTIRSEKTFYKEGEPLYVKLEPKNKFWQATAITTKKGTDQAIYLRGRTQYNYHSGNLRVTYGIENYFVPEGEGKEIEKNMQGAKSTIAVEVVIDNNGNAMIKRLFVNEKPF